MAKKIIKLTESDLHNIVKRVIKENKSNKKQVSEDFENFINPEAMETGDAILTIVGTVIGMLGIAGTHYIKAAIKKLRKAGQDEEADKVQDALETEMSKMEGGNEEMNENFRRNRNRSRR